jgi:hypothetical protein
MRRSRRGLEVVMGIKPVHLMLLRRSLAQQFGALLQLLYIFAHLRIGVCMHVLLLLLLLLLLSWRRASVLITVYSGA